MPDQPMPDEHMSDQHASADITRATAHLPGLEIEIAHRRAANAEHISVHMQAMPSFDAFGRFFENANPFAYWAQAAQLMWLPFLPLYAPWLTATRALMPPHIVDEAPPTSPED